MQEDLTKYYKTLGLLPGAREEDVKVAYENLVRAWHPGRFDEGSDMRAKAIEQLKEINFAFGRIQAGNSSFDTGTIQIKQSQQIRLSIFQPGTSEEAQKMGVDTGEHKEREEASLSEKKIRVARGQPIVPSENKPSDATKEKEAGLPAPALEKHLKTRKLYDGNQHSFSLHKQQREGAKKRNKWFGGLTLVVLVGGTVALFSFLYFSEGSFTSFSSVGRVDSSVQEPKPSPPVSQEDSPKKENGDLPQVKEEGKNIVLEPGPEQQRDTSSVSSRDYITLGSSADEVLALHGAPTRAEPGRWYYGLSSIRFSKGRVVGWNSRDRHPLKVKMLPSAPIQKPPSRFGVGSTKDEVLVVQGTPSAFTENAWYYGLSVVMFSGGKVIMWSENIQNPLKVVNE